MPDNKQKLTLTERAINELSNNKAKEVVDLVDFLNENKLSISNPSGGLYHVKYRGNKICRISMNHKNNPATLELIFFSQYVYTDKKFEEFAGRAWEGHDMYRDYTKFITDDDVKDFIMKHIQGPHCLKDGKLCHGVVTSIFDTEEKAYCYCHPIPIRDVQSEDYPIVKRLFLVNKVIIDDMKAKK